MHDGSPYAQQLTVVTATNFTKMGGTVLSQEAIAPTDVDMHPLLTRIAAGDADVWGLTDSHQIRFHLQSYFLAFRAPALHSDAWRRFWRRVRPLPSKHAVILRYELGLTRLFMREGLRCQALWPAAGFPLPGHLRSPSLLRLNPTHDLWRQLLDAGFPFIKRELLHDNPARVPDVSEWRHIVHASDGAVLEEIEQDLPASGSRSPRSPSASGARGSCRD